MHDRLGDIHCGKDIEGLELRQVYWILSSSSGDMTELR